MSIAEFEHFTELLVNYTDDLICLHEPEGNYLYVTPSSKTLLGYSPEELIGKSPYTLFHPEDAERIRSGAHALALQGSVNITETYRMRKKNGGYIWLETLTHPICDEAGNVLFLVTTSRDVTRRRQLELELQANQELLETFFQQSLEACFFMMLDRPIRWDDTVNKEEVLEYALDHQRLTRINSAFAQQYQLPVEELIGLTARICFKNNLELAKRLWRALFDLAISTLKLNFSAMMVAPFGWRGTMFASTTRAKKSSATLACSATLAIASVYKQKLSKKQLN